MFNAALNFFLLTGVKWTPVGTYTAPFVGVFNGNGYSIKNLSVVYDTQDTGESMGFYYTYGGLFGVTEGAEIKDIKFENVNIECLSTVEYRIVYAGAVAGMMNNSKLSNCTVSGTINAKSFRFVSSAGALAGYTKHTKITNCSSNASVTVQESSNRAEAGGLIGYSAIETIITDCYSEGSVSAYSNIGIAYSGGLIGYASATKVTRCYSKSAVLSELTSSAPEEGKVGSAYSGGLIGLVTAASKETQSEISYSYTIDGTITANGNENIAFAGGLAAKSAYASFKNCYTLTNVTAQSNLEIIYIGGAFGEITAGTTVTGSYCKNNVAALAGDNTNVYIGTFSVYIPTPDEKDPVEYVKNSIYYNASQYTINGKDAGSELTKNAIGRTLSTFTNFETLCFDLKWEKSEWEFQNNIPIPLIPNEMN